MTKPDCVKQNVRYGKPVQTPPRGADMDNPECVTFEQGQKTTAARCPITRNGTMNGGSWPRNVNKNRNEKPIQTPYWGAEVINPDWIVIKQRMKTKAAEVCWNLADNTEPSRCQETAVAAEGAGTGGTTNVRGRLIDCH